MRLVYHLGKAIFQRLQKKEKEEEEEYLPAFRLFTGEDGHSFVQKGKIPFLQKSNLTSFYFKTTPPGSIYKMHNAPDRNYVLTMKGMLEFTTSLGQKFRIEPGVVLLAEDTDGYGHSWKMLGKDPWIRSYLLYGDEEQSLFIPDSKK